MKNRKAIAVNARPVADRYSASGERIIEVSSPNGGALISLSMTVDGHLDIDVYRMDPTVRIVDLPRHRKRAIEQAARENDIPVHQPETER